MRLVRISFGAHTALLVEMDAAFARVAEGKLSGLVPEQGIDEGQHDGNFEAPRIRQGNGCAGWPLWK